MGEEFLDADVDKPLRLTIGFDGSKTGSTHAVVIETTDTVSGAPRYPDMVPDGAWWQWRHRRAVRRVNEDRVREWERAYAAWVDDGKPDREVLIRRYIPNARIEVAGD